MPLAALLEDKASRTGRRHQQGALELAQRFQRLSIAAREIAASVMYGVHGRRRAGAGETFWQFRPFVSGEAAARIDWRRSAKDDRLYVREREWEAAHTVFIWICRSASMRYSSTLALEPKIDRALVLGLAIADLLVRGGERAALLGLTPPLSSRGIVERFAEALMMQEAAASEEPEALPAQTGLPFGAQAVLIGDFLAEPERISAMIEGLSSRGARGHLVMVTDPVEETFPFEGHTEFIGVGTPGRLRAGRAEAFRSEYLRRLAAHRAAIERAARKQNWTLTVHRTGRPATEALLALQVKLESASAALRLAQQDPQS
ncbi:MAG TPA: DUF58 domain-containing protein [Methylocella sp.]|nr:DUF58 domain-containing protein [Methylocella sp.]